MRYWLAGIAVIGVIAAVWIFRFDAATTLGERFGTLSQGRVTLVERIGTPSQGRVVKSDEEWKEILTPEQYKVTRLKGTEPRECGMYTHSTDHGIYTCVCCGQPLFDAKAQYNSRTGWASFWQPIDEENVSFVKDHALIGQRMEVLCSRCDAHLGHVFSDGPPPTGLRYCMNSAALKLVKREK